MFNLFERIKNNNICFLWGGAFVALIAVLVPMLWKEIDCDSVFYISMAERVAEGKKLYVDVSMGYTPLWVYIAAGLKTFLHIPDRCYLFYQVLHLFFWGGVAVLVASIARELNIQKSIALFGAWFVIMGSLLVNGYSVLLEIPSLCFGLLSLWLILRRNEGEFWFYLIIGVIASCAFLVKQYGFGFFALDLYAILFLRKKGWKECLCFIAGYCLPIALCVGYWGNIFLMKTLFNGYGTSSASEAGWDVSMGNKFLQIAGCLLHFTYWICPMVLGGLLFVKEAFRRDRLAELVLAYFGVFGFSLQFYFSCYDHYMLFLVPFAALLTMIVLSLGGAKFVLLRRFLVVWMVLVPVFYHFGWNCYHEMVTEGQLKSKQYELAENIQSYVEPNSVVWVGHYGLFHLYLTADFVAPNLATIGYSFGPMGLNEEKAFEQVNHSDWVVRNNPISIHETFFTDSLVGYLDAHETIYLNDSSIVLHKIR